MSVPTIDAETRAVDVPTSPVKLGSQGEDVRKLVAYLTRFGYFPNESLRRVNAMFRSNMAFAPEDPETFDETVEQAVKLYQQFHGLTVDGYVGPETLDLMAKPRCGFPDIVVEAPATPIEGALVDEYVLQGNKWTTSSLTYHFDNLTPDLPAADSKAAIRGAFDKWAAVTPLMFTESAGPSDIRIGWYTGNHGDGSAFDGPSGVLAHCFYPPPNGGDIAGDCHFDEAETWSVNTPPSGIDLPTVALHELGHGLGLAHSTIPSAVMYAYYGGPRRELTNDDIGGIQALYGQRFRWGGLGAIGGAIGDIAVGSNADGRMEVFIKGSDNTLYHKWQTAPNNGWSNWSSLGGVLTSQSCVGNNADGRMEVFARGTDNALWHRWQTAPNGNWSAWASLGGVITGAPCVGRNADGRMEVFARGTDGAVWHRWQTVPNGDWSGWASLGGVISTDPTVQRNADGRLEIFARGTDNALWHTWQTTPNGTWSGWASLGGAITSMTAVGRNADGRMEVFVRGTDNALWHKWQTVPNGDWSGWASLGGVLTSDPMVERNADGRLEVFVRGTDAACWHIWQVAPNGSWSGWSTLGGGIVGRPVPWHNADGRLEVFVRGTDGALYNAWQNSPGGSWA